MYEVIIFKVVYTLQLDVNLLSARKLTEKGYNIIFKNNTVHFYNNKIHGQGVYKINAYILNVKIISNNNIGIINTGINKIYNIITDIVLYYRRLGHINKNHFLETLKHILGLKMQNNNNKLFCEPCVSGKQHEVINYKKISNLNQSFELIHTNIAGPFRIQGLKSKRYIITFTNDFTKAV